ncbi:MAG: AmmeMemoRadiSam system radical SAM enzyme [Candidatus Cloacimonadales bacterium]
MREAEFYQALPNGDLQCQLCPHFCLISPGELGRCRSRKNQAGKLLAINYGETVSLSLDPIEKKPLYHFYPGSQILSLGANGCNFACSFCQNYQISQSQVPTRKITPNEIVQLCSKYQVNSVAFTYTEPFIWYEFVLDSAKILRAAEIEVVLVSNGFINPAPLKKILPFISAMNIDLKAYDDDFYQKYCAGKLAPVLQTIQIAAPVCHLEITNLLISGLNDSQQQIESLVDFIYQIDPQIPLHFSRYYPCYKMDLPATKFSVLQQAARWAEKLAHVYLGNVAADDSIYCANCGKLLIERQSATNNLANGKCKFCGQKLYGKYIPQTAMVETAKLDKTGLQSDQQPTKIC